MTVDISLDAAKSTCVNNLATIDKRALACSNKDNFMLLVFSIKPMHKAQKVLNFVQHLPWPIPHVLHQEYT